MTWLSNILWNYTPTGILVQTGLDWYGKIANSVISNAQEAVINYNNIGDIVDTNNSIADATASKASYYIEEGNYAAAKTLQDSFNSQTQQIAASYGADIGGNNSPLLWGGGASSFLTGGINLTTILLLAGGAYILLKK